MRVLHEAVPLGRRTLMVWLQTAIDPTDADWNAQIRALGEMKQRLGGDVSRMPALIVSDGGAPGARPRNVIFRDIHEGRAVMAVVSNALANPVKRGIVTAITWLNPTFRAYGPNGASDALEHVGCRTTSELDATWRALERMQRELPRIVTLELVAKKLEREVPPARDTVSA